MKVSISLPLEKWLAKPLRDFVFKILKNIGMDEYESESISLGIVEAYINILEHEKCNDNIELSIISKDKLIEFNLIDKAEKIDFKKLKSRLLSDFREGGLGLYIISSVVDEAYYEDIKNGNKLVLKKYL
jgi:serine/threonine-protein kinase RsbW